jgi:hypothetical protein
MRSISLPIAMVFTLLSCALASCQKKTVDSPAFKLRLGRPGVIKHENNLPKHDNVQVLEKGETITFNSDTGEATINHNPNRRIEVGDIIIGNEDQQYLLKVKEVTERKELGRTDVIVRQSHVEQLLEKDSGSLKLEATPKYDLKDFDGYTKAALKNNDPSTYQVDDNGKLVIRNMDLLNVDINSDNQVTTHAVAFSKFASEAIEQEVNVMNAVGGNYKVHLNEASVEVIPTIRSEVAWSWGSISKMQTRFDTRVRYKVDITYELSGSAKMDAAVDLLPKKIIPVRIPGAVPIYMDIELSIPAGISLEGTGKTQARVIYSADYEFYSVTNYDETTGLKTESNKATKILEKSVSVSTKGVEVSAELYLKPTITTRLYRVLGPYAYLQPYVRGELEVPARVKKDDLFIGVGGGIGFEVSEPIFKTAVVNYDTGRIFDFALSWDLDNYNGPAEASSPVDKPDTVKVDTIGNEGFVVLNAKPLAKDHSARFELSSQPKYGILVPSENFFIDGQLYYYPLSGQPQDSFVIHVLGEGGETQEVPVTIELSNEVKEKISKERFALTTNSVKVATEGSAPYADQVAHYGVGGGLGIRAAAQRVIPMDACRINATDFNEDPGAFKSEDSFFTRLTTICGELGSAVVPALRAEAEQYLARRFPPPADGIKPSSPTQAHFDLMAMANSPANYFLAKNVLECSRMPLEIAIDNGYDLNIKIANCSSSWVIPSLFAIYFPKTSESRYDLNGLGTVRDFAKMGPVSTNQVWIASALHQETPGEAAANAYDKANSGSYDAADSEDSNDWVPAMKFTTQMNDAGTKFAVNLEGKKLQSPLLIAFNTFTLKLVEEEGGWRIERIFPVDTSSEESLQVPASPGGYDKKVKDNLRGIIPTARRPKLRK